MINDYFILTLILIAIIVILIININTNYYYLLFGCPTANLGHYRGDSFTHPTLITPFVKFLPEGHREPRGEVGSLSPAEHLVGFEPDTFQFLSRGLNSLAITASLYFSNYHFLLLPLFID